MLRVELAGHSLSTEESQDLQLQPRAINRYRSCGGRILFATWLAALLGIVIEGILLAVLDRLGQIRSEKLRPRRDGSEGVVVNHRLCGSGDRNHAGQ